MSDQLKAGANGLSIASLLFGILALLTSITVIPVLFFASLAIMFSWLSRGNRRMNGQALAGNILAIISIIISICVVVALIFGVLGWTGGAHSGLTLREMFEYVKEGRPVLNLSGIWF